MPKKKKNKLVKSIKGEIRKIHFESGGSPQNWRGLSATHKTSDEKRNNRKTKKTNAIDDSES